MTRLLFIVYTLLESTLTYSCNLPSTKEKPSLLSEQVFITQRGAFYAYIRGDHCTQQIKMHLLKRFMGPTLQQRCETNLCTDLYTDLVLNANCAQQSASHWLLPVAPNRPISKEINNM